MRKTQLNKGLYIALSKYRNIFLTHKDEKIQAIIDMVMSSIAPEVKQNLPDSFLRAHHPEKAPSARNDNAGNSY